MTTFGDSWRRVTRRSEGRYKDHSPPRRAKLHAETGSTREACTYSYIPSLSINWVVFSLVMLISNTLSFFILENLIGLKCIVNGKVMFCEVNIIAKQTFIGVC